MNVKRIEELTDICLEMRKDIIRMSKAAGASGLHFGGSLSMIEITAALYLEIMQMSPEKIHDEYRDRLIISKGHGVPAVYAAMKHAGIIPPEELDTFKKDVTRLYGHPSMNPDLGIEFSSGSLGQGLSLGVGTAIGLQNKKNNTSRVFVILGDGECDEGSVWEAAMSAAQYGLSRLTAVIDRNHIQYDGDTENILKLESLGSKWQSFGWECITVDGHDVAACCEAFRKQTDRPLAVICNTVKGKGISFMENEPGWHHKKMTAQEEQQAMEELHYDIV